MLMTRASAPQLTAAVIDYGLGNLYSVRRACERAGMRGLITSRKDEILSADMVILPGMGAFEDAMSMLRKLDLVEVLRNVAASGTPLVGICLGMQLLMSESAEFGLHEGLDIIAGQVIRFENPQEHGRVLKVPQVQWNRIARPTTGREGRDVWEATPLEGIDEGEYMYFVHSYYAVPMDQSVVLSVSQYGHFSVCSSLSCKNIFACQFHPERSGYAGLRIYENLARLGYGEKGALR